MDPRSVASRVKGGETGTTEEKTGEDKTGDLGGGVPTGTTVDQGSEIAGDVHVHRSPVGPGTFGLVSTARRDLDGGGRRVWNPRRCRVGSPLVRHEGFTRVLGPRSVDFRDGGCRLRASDRPRCCG